MPTSRLSFAAGVLAGSVCTALVSTVGVPSLSVTSAGAPAQTAKAAATYESKVVLENDLVRVKDVTFPAGELDTGMHTHDLAHVGVILTAGTLVFTEPGGKKDTVEFASGSVGFRGANATHMVANPGTTPMRVIEVEIKKP